MNMTNQEISPKPGRYLSKKKSAAGSILCTAVLGIGFMLFFAAKWYLDTYGDTGFDSILYTLSSDLDGVQSGLILKFLLGAVLPSLILTAAGAMALFFPPRKFRAKKWYPLPKAVSHLTALVLSAVMLTHAALTTGLPEYIYGLFHETPIFEEKYVDPDSVQITFPEEKRNLIYIYLESMETTFFAQKQGGAMEENHMPELYALAEENLNFSQNKGVGGFRPVNGATWTIAAMVAHTAGVPLKIPLGVGENDYGQDDGGFLPGIVSLQDILDREGYYQTLMVGSVASFGGREQYYLQHGADYVYELVTARKDGIVPGDYFVWWGMEDKYLFEYAKQELQEISQREEPFAFTMLTVDTHHIGGYKCEYCQDTYEEQYENVMSCSSRQVAEFVSWLKEQDFYENTTIVITGDHLSMDNGYFDRNVSDSYTRRNYNCFINSAVDTKYNKNREFCALDMFPTTLAAMGCKIEGEHLGLGTNLFSGKPTLIETMGYQRFDHQLSLNSDYYAEQFRLEIPEEEEENQ